MARSPNCTGAPLYKGRVDVTISYPDPDETLLETPVALPTSEPGTAQISYTLASGHMPVWSPYELEHVKTAILYAAGKNTGGSAVTVYYRILKNGTSVATGSASVSAGQYYTGSHAQFLDAKVGDALSCKLWASVSGVNWDYKAILVWPTRIGPKGQSIAAFTAHGFGAVYALTLGNPDVAASGLCAFYPFGSSNPKIDWAQGYALKAAWSDELYGFARVGVGDMALNSYISSHWVYHPAYYTLPGFTRISYTPLNLRV